MRNCTRHDVVGGFPVRAAGLASAGSARTVPRSLSVRTGILFFLVLLLAGCTPEPEAVAPPVATVLATAGREGPPVYADFAAVAPLLRQRNDTTYLVNFWATWCKPCLEELPLLQELADGSGPELRVLLVSLDTEARAIDRIPAYLTARGIDLPTVVLTDERTGWYTDVDANWRGELPTTVIYRNELRYVYRRAFNTAVDVRGAVAPLLR